MTEGAGEAPPLVSSASALAELIEQLGEEPIFALDTEFHRERTYRPQLALIQVSWAEGAALVDPLSFDNDQLAGLFDHGSEVVLHAAQQDLDVLTWTVGAAPKRIFDTQLAAGFLGMSSPSLTAVCERFIGVNVPKAERMTDWLERPLSSRQREYAAADVAHLLRVRELQLAELELRGRTEWLEEETELLVARSTTLPGPDEAWRRIKGANQLSGTKRAVLAKVAAWRERRAAELDKPLRWVLSDMAVLNIAERAPSSTSKLASVRGVEDGFAQGRLGREVLEAVEQGKGSEPPSLGEDGRPLRPALKPLVPLVNAWVGQLGRDEDLDPALLASRRDVEDLLRGRDGARLATGWRAELLGEPIERLLKGEVAIAFEDEGRLVLEQRSGSDQ